MAMTTGYSYRFQLWASASETLGPHTIRGRSREMGLGPLDVCSLVEVCERASTARQQVRVGMGFHAKLCSVFVILALN